jgi:Flp pilus assembly protein TadD
MPTVPEAFEEAVQLLQAGQTSEAKQICGEIVATDPNFADAWHLLGVISLQAGQGDLAAGYLQRAVQLNPNDPEAHNNLGSALRSQTPSDKAIDHFRRAVALRPDFPEALLNLGNALTELGRSSEASQCYQRVMQLAPGHSEIYNRLGVALLAQGRADEALASYRQAIELNPSHAEAHFNLGAAFLQHQNFEASIAPFQEAVKLKPDYAEAHSNLGSACLNLDRYDDAIASFRRALELKPENAEFHYNLGSALLLQGKNGDAAASFRRAVELAPNHANAQWNLATLMLAEGDFNRGWPKLEWRWRTGGQAPREFTKPIWGGDSLQERTILLTAEQGLGDTIQFIRYATIVKSQGANVIVECPPPLLKLLATCPGIDQLIGQGIDRIPNFDVHLPLISLPGVLRTNLSNIPANVPYLFADSDLVKQWRDKLAHTQGFRVGICWRGQAGPPPYRRRHIPVEKFAALTEVSGVQLVSLQKGEDPSASATAEGKLTIFNPGDDIDQANGPFMDTAAIMKNLDLVITADTSIAHLAGALGVPVWVALPFAADWRWLRDRSDSPWYPTMRLFRQPAPNDWTSVFKEIQSALRTTTSR